MAVVTAETVRDLYRGILKREPESEAAVQHFANSSQSVADLAAAFVSSAEFRASQSPGATTRTEKELWLDGLTRPDEDLLRRHLCASDPEHGFVKTFIGTKQRVAFANIMARLDGYVFRDIPTRVGDMTAEPIEFVGVIKAVEAGSGPFVAVELGAGVGTWSVSAGHLARRMGRAPIHLFAVEGSAGKVANMRQNFVDNGFNPDNHTIVHAVIGPADGTAYFPIIDAIEHWGAEAIFMDRRSKEERPGYTRERCVSLTSLLAKETIVDLLHVDIQGAERDVLPAAIDMLDKKVRYVVVGTHSRVIDGELHGLFGGHGWVMENDAPARVICEDGATKLWCDGTQVWRNPKV